MSTFQEIGKKGRDLLVDEIVDLGLTPLIKHYFPDAGEESWQRLIYDEMGNFDDAQEEYATCRTFVLEDTGKTIKDAFSENSEAKVSRLFQNISEQLETNSPKVEASSIEVFLSIQLSATQQIKTMKLKEKAMQLGALIPPVDPRPEHPPYY